MRRINRTTTFANAKDLLKPTPTDATGLRRVLLHSGSDDMQSMLIYMPSSFTFPFIADNLEGEISFAVLYGELTIDIIEHGYVETYFLKASDVLYTERRNYRQTRTGKHECVYFENLSGGFRPSARVAL